jgi:hypothetical protein
MRCTSERVEAARGQRNGETRGRLLPIKGGGEEFGYELLIIWAENVDVNGSVTFAV